MQAPHRADPIAEHRETAGFVDDEPMVATLEKFRARAQRLVRAGIPFPYARIEEAVRQAQRERGSEQARRVLALGVRLLKTAIDETRGTRAAIRSEGELRELAARWSVPLSPSPPSSLRAESFSAGALQRERERAERSLTKVRTELVAGFLRRAILLGRSIPSGPSGPDGVGASLRSDLRAMASAARNGNIPGMAEVLSRLEAVNASLGPSTSAMATLRSPRAPVAPGTAVSDAGSASTRATLHPEDPLPRPLGHLLPALEPWSTVSSGPAEDGALLAPMAAPRATRRAVHKKSRQSRPPTRRHRAGA
jgi:hypothetical protein